tara:strand:- start:1729 stop:2211 length:483 start_codon:yes stop_codon:yes gene_type:complete
MKRLFILLGIGGIAFGLYSFYIKQLEILGLLTYKLKKVSLENANIDSVSLNLELEVQNNSDISIEVSNYYFDVFVNDIFVGVIENAKVNQTLKGLGGVSVFNPTLRIKNAALFGKGLISGLTSNFKNSTLTLKGIYGLKKGLIKIKDLPIDETFKFKDFM